MTILDLMVADAGGNTGFGVGTGITLGFSAGMAENQTTDLVIFTIEDIRNFKSTYDKAKTFADSEAAGFVDPTSTVFEYMAIPAKNGSKDIFINVKGEVNINDRKMQMSQSFSTGVSLKDEEINGTNVTTTNSVKR